MNRTKHLKKSYLLFSLFFLLVVTPYCKETHDWHVTKLSCENLKIPLGIGIQSPRFSWKNNCSRQGSAQSAYQIIVASDTTLLDEKDADLWNSGKTNSRESVLIAYKGKKLNSGEYCYWKVRVWDESGNVSLWSPIAVFSIGLLNKDDWHASYIGFPCDAGCPQLKKTFKLDVQGKRTLLYVNSLGYHEVYLNGKKVGDAVLTPAVSQFDKRSQVIAYDVSSFLTKGQNDIVLWLGSGWYSKGLPGVVNEGPLVKAQLEQFTGNSRKIIVATDSTWEGRSSRYKLIGKWRSWSYGGEKVDGRISSSILSAGNIDDKGWGPVKEVAVPEHEVSPQMVELNYITDTIKPISVLPLSEKTFLVDMGKNLTGWVEIHFPKLQLSQEVKMEYCDHLDGVGHCVVQNQIDRYIASGKGEEVFKNKFNYHGFRYIKISNLEKALDKGSINAYLIHTGYELASAFQCSDADLNKIHDMIFYTLRCLSLGGYLVDCPQIERLGYGGDGNASTVTAQTMFNLSPLYSNWLQAWRDCIRSDGGMPHTAPNPFAAGGGPYWCGFIITAAWNTYLTSGDSQILEKCYPVMQRWLEYVERYSPQGLLKQWPKTDYRGWYLGDWATPKGVDQTAEASVDLVSNCYIAVCYDDMQKIAQVLGKATDNSQYTLKRDQLRKKIHETFFDNSKSIYATGTQIDLSYPLLAGVVPEQFLRGVKNSLVYEIEHNRTGHFACGLVGIPVFTEWAIQNKEVNLMYSMLKKRDYPGYLYMIDNGATTTWEHWNGDRSRIHNCYNGIGSWFYQAVGGIRPVEDGPGYRKVLIQPQVPQGVNWAKVSKETPYGTIYVNWQLKGENMEMQLEIPVGTTAELCLPAITKSILINKKKNRIKEGHDLILQSGKYSLQYLYKN